jgi:hypothetical protein
MGEATNDLIDYMREATRQIAEDYRQIQKRATEDAGTAGDQGEENWKGLLKRWLPAGYYVETKGRVMFPDGRCSRQMDVLVLKPSYPPGLLDKKLYLAGGVAAAFECKLTLKASHVREAVQKAAKLRKGLPARYGTPRRELQSPIVYGLLAHSHSWKGEQSKPLENIEIALSEAEEQFTEHPRQGLDLICIADLAAWAYVKSVYVGPSPLSLMTAPLDRPDTREERIKNKGPVTTSVRYSPELQGEESGFTPIGATILRLLVKLAWEDPSLRDIVEYLDRVPIAGNSMGMVKNWDFSVYSDEVIDRLFADELDRNHDTPWDEWSRAYF